MTNPYAPPQAVVQDIADPAAGILLADRGTRLGAAILDGLVVALMVYLPLIGGLVADGIAETGATEPGSGAGVLIGTGLALVGFVAWLWLTIKYLRANGQSIGKKACRIKILRRDGSPVSVSRVIWLRNGLNMLIGLIPVYGLVDALFIFGEARRCVHDYLADTIVIKA
jgi:uncharacterized RDD family membrane protein YckC